MARTRTLTAPGSPGAVVVPAWPPTRYSEPLAPVFRSAADPYLPALRYAWRQSFGYSLEEWQVELVRAILELGPLGVLRYRQVLVSVGRQNGKSEIAALLGLLILLARTAPLVIGIASSAEQARIIYQRTMQAINGTDALRKRFARLTDTRGITTKTMGRYELKAAKGAALQGLPIDLGIVDEVHLLSHDLWNALVNGTGGRDDCLVVGITTAGDDSSELLKHLYGLADSGEGGTTFGFFVWEAPEARVPDDDETLGYFLRCANPALASGRVPIENVVADVRSMPPADVIRYRLNRFVASTGEFVPIGLWNLCAGTLPDPPASGVVFAVDRSPGWEYASVTASWKAGDAIVTELVACEVRPSPEGLVELLAGLVGRWAPRAVVMDSYSLKAVGAELKLRGVPVVLASLADVASASALFYSRVQRKGIVHPGDPLLSVQLPGARRKNIGGSEGFRVTRADGSLGIDAVVSTLLGTYFAETLPEIAPQLFV